MNKPKYFGRILNGNYSQAVKDRITAYIECFSALEKTENPAILYLAAWEEAEKSIWYEYASNRLVDLFNCNDSEIADVFRNSVIDRRIYKYQNIDSVQKEILPKRKIDGIRKELRENSKKTGMIEAVYQIRPTQGQPIWLKDQATVEILKPDNICLSSGCLTDVSKEMEAEEERGKILTALQDAMAKVKTLSGMLPICASCKNIRDDKGYWNQIETYIRDHSEADFSHSICPDCAKKLYPGLDHPDGG